MIKIKVNVKDREIKRIKPYKIFVFYGIVSLGVLIFDILHNHQVGLLTLFNIILAFGFAFYIRKDIVRFEIVKRKN